jgi:hypothetical protein
MTPFTLTKLLPLFSAATAFCLVSCASVAAERAPPTRIEQACAQIMGLRKGEAQFGDCVDSLSDTLGRKSRVEATDAIAQACDETMRGTASFSFCVLGREKALTLPSAIEADNAPLAFDGPRKSFFNLLPAETEEREKYACAALGVDADTGLFSICVNDLDARLSEEPLR